MILVTGGSGFIGSHTEIDSRVKCVVAQVPGVSLSIQLWVDMMLPGGDVAALEAAIHEDQRDRLLRKESRYVSMDAPPDSEPEVT